MTTPEIPVVPFDPEIIPIVQAIPAMTAVPTVEEIPAMREGPGMPVPPIEAIIGDRPITAADRAIPGPVGAPDLEITVISPSDLAAPVPALYNIHGGGMIMGDRTMDNGRLVDLVDKLGVIAVNIDYRLAPEHPDPAPVEDCYAGLQWVASHASELGVDPTRIVVMGGSAGGGLSAGVALLARDRGGPDLAGQLLLCPMIDDLNSTPASHQYMGLGTWPRELNLLGWRALLGESAGDPEADVSIYAAPARATDLTNLPPAFIEVGSAEMFRDEDVAYASRIWAAGGQAELHVWSGGCHGFDMFAPESALTAGALASRENWLRRILGL